MSNLTQHKIGKCNPKLQEWEYSQLKEDIASNGIRQPIVIYDGKILDGWTRYEIGNTLKIPCPTTEYTGSNPASFVKSTIQHRNMSKEQKACVLLELDDWITKETLTANIIKSLPTKGTKGFQKVEGSLRQKEKESGIDKSTLSRAVALKEESPALFAKLKAGEVTLGDIIKEKKVAQRKSHIASIKRRIAKENKTITDKFDVLVIDPPWDYKERVGSGVDDYDPTFNRACADYPTMSLKDIADIKLPVKNDAVVFLWTTHAFLHDAFHLIDQWGLTYRATIVWDKEKMGLGGTIRLQCEFCLLAVRGHPLLQGSSERDIIREAKREHSRKPEAFYKLVDRMTVGNKLDYFARTQRKGWQVYGAETDKF